MRPALGLALALLLPPAGDAVEVSEDFEAAALPVRWKASPASWRPADGALRGTGGGQIDLVEPVGGDFDLAFEASSSAKANVEVHLVDPETGATRLTFAFLGRYHTVLKGARTCILDGPAFVAVTPEMWIWPGRRFTFRVGRKGRECTSFLDGVAGPAYVAPAAPAAAESFLLRILVSPDTADASVLIDSIRLLASRPGKGTAPAPAAPAEPVPPADPAAAPSFEVARTAKLEVHNHADPTFVTATIAAELQKQYDWLKEWFGVEPGRIAVHVGGDYPCGFARSLPTGPEMFLQSGTIFDSQANYAHEMAHCFHFRFGMLPHWFAESMADMAYADAEISLWKRRKEEPFLKAFDTPDHRSWELGRLRVKYGKGFFPKVCRLLQRDRAKCLATFVPGASPEAMNEFLMKILSEAAGEDLRPMFTKELGFDLKTRERQRGY